MNKLLGIALILLALICLPISFASECNVDGIDDASLSQSCDQINNDANLEDNLNLDGTDLESNNLDLDNSISDDLGSDDYILDDYNPENLVSHDYNPENSNLLDENTESNDDNGNHNLADGNAIDYNSPNLSLNFTNLDIIFTNDNTIFVNASYSGNVESGTIENPFRTFNSAYALFSNSSNTKTNIYLANGVYQISNSIKINKNINIVGESTSNTIISGANNYQIFYISPPQTYGAVSPLVNVFNLTLANGISYYGGAIYMNESGANFVNVNFVNNTARNSTASYYSTKIYPGSGGAVYIEKSFVKFYNSHFIGNKALGDGDSYAGALLNDMGEITIINSQFTNNTVLGDYGSGGAIYDYSGILVLFNSTISNNIINSSYAMGGGISTWASHNVYVLNSTIDGNSLYGNYTFGSAIINKANNLIISNTTISNNLANGICDSNGTFFNLNGFVNESNLHFENNIAQNPQKLFMCLEDQLIIERPFDDASLVDLPSKYDLRDYGWVSPVKDQGGSGSCWAFTTLAALESYLLKYENISYDFSENNMKNLMGIYGLNGTDWSDGGNHFMSLAYLLRWSGPLNESQDPFDDSGHASPSNLKPIKLVQDVLYLPVRLNYLDINQIKAALMTYGALYTTINADSSFQYNPDYYLDVISVSNHAITLIGWDDNYSADNFAVRPPGDGAFIIKNSWNTDHGYDGYWYISYYDKTFAGYGLDTLSAMAFTKVGNATDYKTNYQYDILGNTFESIGFECSTAWFANQFTAKNNNPLSAFGLYTYGDSSYLVNITVNGVVKHIQEGIIKGAGYHTIKLDEFVELTKDDVFRVAVKLTTPISLFPVAIEAQRSGYSSGADAEEGQSFISPDGINWYDLASYNEPVKFFQYAQDHTLEKANVCLKAYASGYADVFLNIKSNASVYHSGDNVEITLTITNEGDYISDVNVKATLDSGVTVKSASYFKGGFNYSTKVWHLDNLTEGESVSITLKLAINSVKEIVTTSFNFNYSGFIPSTFNTSASLSLNYAGITSIVQLDNVTTIARSQDEVIIKLLDWNSTPLANKAIVISLLESELYDSGADFSFSPVSLVTDGEGNANFILDLIAGNYKFLASFDGDDLHDSSNMTFNVTVSKINTEIRAVGELNLSNITTFARSNDELKFYLIDSSLNIIKDKTLRLFNSQLNQYCDLICDEDGFFTFNLNLTDGTYNFNLDFSNDDVYNNSGLSFVVNVIRKDSPIISIERNLLNVHDNLKISLKDQDGIPLANEILKIIITNDKGNQNSLSILSDDEGMVVFSNLYQGLFNFKIAFEGDDVYEDAFLDSDVTISKRQSQIIYSNITAVAVDTATDGNIGKYFPIVLKDDEGNALANKSVQIGFYGKVYNMKTDENGSCKLQINLANAGTYSLVVSYPGDDEYTASYVLAKVTVNKQKASLTVPNKSYKATAKTKSLTATFKSANGKVVKGKKVTFTVNGKTYSATTNAKGVATVKVSLTKKGTYGVTAKFAGDGTYSAITKTAKLILK